MLPEQFMHDANADPDCKADSLFTTTSTSETEASGRCVCHPPGGADRHDQSGGNDDGRAKLRPIGFPLVSKTLNARAETIITAPTWREPFKKRRCLVPASAFYEWPKEGRTPKQPYAFELSNGDLFAFVGLWDAWKDGQGHWLRSFAIVTTEANKLMARIHPRMPVILYARDYDRWLDREETERLPLDLLRPFESDTMEMYKANPKVNNVSNNGPELLRKAMAVAESGLCLCRPSSTVLFFDECIGDSA